MAEQPKKIVIGANHKYCEGELICVRLKGPDGRFNYPGVKATVIAIDKECYPLAVVVGKTLEPYTDDEFIITATPRHVGPGTVPHGGQRS